MDTKLVVSNLGTLICFHSTGTRLRDYRPGTCCSLRFIMTDDGKSSGVFIPHVTPADGGSAGSISKRLATEPPADLSAAVLVDSASNQARSTSIVGGDLAQGRAIDVNRVLLGPSGCRVSDFAGSHFGLDWVLDRNADSPETISAFRRVYDGPQHPTKLKTCSAKSDTRHPEGSSGAWFRLLPVLEQVLRPQDRAAQA